MKSFFKFANLLDWALGLGVLCAALYWQSPWLAAAGVFSLAIAHFRVTERVSERVRKALSPKRPPSTSPIDLGEDGLEDDEAEIAASDEGSGVIHYGANPPPARVVVLGRSRHNWLHPDAFRVPTEKRASARWF